MGPINPPFAFDGRHRTLHRAPKDIQLRPAAWGPHPLIAGGPRIVRDRERISVAMPFLLLRPVSTVYHDCLTDVKLAYARTRHTPTRLPRCATHRMLKSRSVAEAVARAHVRKILIAIAVKSPCASCALPRVGHPLRRGFQRRRSQIAPRSPCRRSLSIGRAPPESYLCIENYRR